MLILRAPSTEPEHKTEKRERKVKYKTHVSTATQFGAQENK